MKSKRLDPADRKAQLLDIAMQEAEQRGFGQMTRDGIAARAGVAAGLITTRLGTMANLRRDIMRHAVKRGIISIVAEGLALRDPVAQRAPAELRDKAWASLK